jgi:GNAT superfamily N-acetyltransferase
MTIREARPYDAPGVARVHVDTWRSAYRGQVDDDYLDNLDYGRAERTGPAAIARGEGDGVFMLVAADESDCVVGFAVGGQARGGVAGLTGELHALYVSPSCQKGGVGRMLVEAVAQRLHEQGHESMIVWTLAKNPARGFYERLGGTFLSIGRIDIGGVDYEKVAYGWTDIRVLLPSRSSSGS